jgi:spoIIIJ-associated protein
MSEAERSIETTGPDEEVAIAAGLEQLGVGRDQVRIDVLDEARAGVMGLGSREARVRLTVTGDGRVAGADDEAAAPQVVEGGGMAEADTARQLLASLVAHLGIEDAEIDAHLAEAAPGEDEPPIVLDVRGVGTSALIGHHGRTLAALQRIVRLMVGQALSRHIHLVVDVDGFK